MEVLPLSDRLELDLEKIKGTGRRGKRSRFELLTTQAIICVIALLAAIILKTLGGNLYDTARQNYIAHFEDETRVEEVLETIGDALGISEPDENTKESDPVSQQQSLPTSGFPSLPENSDSEPSDTSDDFPVSSDRSGTTYVATDANGQKIAESVGAHVNSIIMPVNGRITSAFGLRIHPISGDERMHGGMDIGGYEGETIGAAMAGTVSKIGEDDSFGEYVLPSESLMPVIIVGTPGVSR